MHRINVAQADETRHVELSGPFSKCFAQSRHYAEDPWNPAQSSLDNLCPNHFLHLSFLTLPFWPFSAPLPPPLPSSQQTLAESSPMRRAASPWPTPKLRFSEPA